MSDYSSDDNRPQRHASQNYQEVNQILRDQQLLPENEDLPGQSDYQQSIILMPKKGQPYVPVGSGASQSLSVCVPGHSKVCGLDLLAMRIEAVSRTSRSFA